MTLPSPALLVQPCGLSRSCLEILENLEDLCKQSIGELEHELMRLQQVYAEVRDFSGHSYCYRRKKHALDLRTIR